MRIGTRLRLRTPTAKERKRRDRDYYPTPRHAIDELLEQHPPPPGRVLEPAAGDGAIVRALVDRGHPVTAVELRAEEQPRLFASGADNVVIADWFDVAGLEWGARSLVTNPPFSIARPFAEACLDVIEVEYLALLLGIDTEASGAWRGFWEAHPWTDRVKLYRRPSFTGDGKTDGRNYCWYVFRPNGG